MGNGRFGLRADFVRALGIPMKSLDLFRPPGLS